MKALGLAVLLTLLSPSAFAAPPCWLVRGYVAKYGQKAALKWAKQNRYSKAEIAEARKCLK